MTATDIEMVSLEDDYYHVRFREPDKFEKIRTPDWAENASDSVSEGSEVRMGELPDEDDWVVQSVLIKKSVGEDKAREKAKKIVEKLNTE